MRRWIVFILLLLWLGAASSVATAWLIEVFREHPKTDFLGREATSTVWVDGWEIDETTGRGWRIRQLEQAAGTPPCDCDLGHIDLPVWSRGHEDVAHSAWVMEVEIGWPVRCMRWTWDQDTRPFRLPSEIVPAGLITAPPERPPYQSPTLAFPSFDDDLMQRQDHRVLPVVPTWGFAISTLMYSSGWFLVSVGLLIPGHLQRVRRHARACCRSCGYQLRGLTSDRCPECGKLIAADRPFPPTLAVSSVAVVASVVTLSVSAFAMLRGRVNEPPTIYEAARWNDVASIKSLVQSGVDPDTIWIAEDWSFSESTDSTPLLWAVAHGHVEAATALLTAGATVDLPTRWRDLRPIHITALTGNAMLMRMLIEAGADVNAPAYFGDSGPLLDTGFWLDGSVDGTPLGMAAASGCLDCVRMLLDSGAVVSPKWNMEYPPDDPLVLAAGSSNPRTIKALLAAGADPNHWVYLSPLAVAAATDRPDNVELLLRAGAAVKDDRYSRSDQNPLQLAIASHSLRSIDLLLDADIQLWRAAHPLVFEAASYWLDGPYGSRPGGHAVEVVDHLIGRGFNPNAAAGDRQWTLLHKAVADHQIALIRLLIARGVNPDCVDGDGRTPVFDLHPWYCCSEAVLDALIEGGANLNAQTPDGTTAMIDAVIDGEPETVELLLNRGADPFVTNNDGDTALDIVRGLTGDPHIIAMLEAAMQGHHSGE